MYAIIRLRGTIKAKPDVKDTLKMLNLHKNNGCTIIHDNPSYRGMLQKVKDYVTWGEVDESMAKKLLSRANVADVDAAYGQLQEGTPLRTIGEAFIGLHPPRKGYRGIKRPYSMGGSAGYRGQHINELLERML